jgi:hypothetical protein
LSRRIQFLVGITNFFCSLQKEIVMTTPQEAYYVVIVWDYDGAVEYLNPEDRSDSIAPYFCRSRRRYNNLHEAENAVEHAVDFDGGCCPGAAVFDQEGKKLFGLGLTFDYREKYY